MEQTSYPIKGYCLERIGYIGENEVVIQVIIDKNVTVVRVIVP